MILLPNNQCQALLLIFNLSHFVLGQHERLCRFFKAFINIRLSACECLYFSVQARVCVVVRTASSSPPLICVTRRRTVRRPASVQASRPSAPHQRRRRTSPSAARAHASVWTGWDAQKHFSRMVAIRQCKTRLHCRRIKSFWISVPEEVKGKERRFRRF